MSLRSRPQPRVPWCASRSSCFSLLPFCFAAGALLDRCRTCAHLLRLVTALLPAMQLCQTLAQHSRAGCLRLFLCFGPFWGRSPAVKIVSSLIRVLCAPAEAEFYSCAATGQPLPADVRGGGPASTGCQKATLDTKTQVWACSYVAAESGHVSTCFSKAWFSSCFSKLWFSSSALSQCLSKHYVTATQLLFGPAKCSTVCFSEAF